MNYDEAKAILKELYKDRPDLIFAYNEDLGGEVTTCSYGTNNLERFKQAKGYLGWDVMINKRFLFYRMYVLNVRLRPVKAAGVESIMLKKIEPVELKTFLQEQLRLADKVKR